MNRSIYTIVLLSILFFACNEESKLEKEIAQIPVDITIERFDQYFSKVTPETLPDLKNDYPFLFPKQYPNQVWLDKLNDTIQIEVNEEVAKAFPNFSQQKNELYSFYQHLKYYFPGIKVPRIITVTSDVDYHNKVVLSSDKLLISLDTYLGKEHHFYDGIQVFLKDNFRIAQLTPDVVSIYAKQLIGRPKQRTFLANMIYYGKELYLKDVLIPSIPDEEKIGYTKEKYEWAIANEEEVWRYFIEKELLYSTDTSLLGRFLHPGPFSKFYLELDNESPDRLGQFIGWHIVNSYMKNNDVSLQQLLMADAETIFKKSKYKPAR